MNKILLKIKEKNKVIYFRNRNIRTPVMIELTRNEIKKANLALKIADINDYIYEEKEVEKKIRTSEIRELVKLDKDVLVEEIELCEEPKSILEKLLKDGEL